MTPNPGQPEPTDKTNKVLVSVVLDRSGSMNSTRAGTISGYNEYINGLRADKESDYSVTLIQFDAPMAAPELTISYQDRALADVPELTEAGYVPRGNTPLYDAIGECIRRTEAKGRAVIVLVITDGYENASTEFNKDSIKALIKGKEAEGWTFAFLGANIDSYEVGGSVGVPLANVANYVAGHEKTMYQTLARATNERAAFARTVGVMSSSTMSFIGDESREKIENPGGRPAAPGSFQRQPPIPTGRTPVEGKRRDWNTTKA